MKKSILEIRNIKKTYKHDGKSNCIIPGLNLNIGTGSFTVIMGSSGTGKSTLLHLIAGLDHEYDGMITVHGEQLNQLSEKSAALFRRRNIGLVFQDAMLIPNLTLLENVVIAGFKNASHKESIHKHAIQLLEYAGLSDCLDRLPHQISGGEQQRCAVVRALINNPVLLLADEPTGNLNSSASENILELFLKIHKEGQTVLMVTHDIKSASLGDRILYFQDGEIIDELELKNEVGSRSEKEKLLNNWLIQKQW